MKKQPEIRTPKTLDAIADVALAYRPKPKSAGSKKRMEKTINIVKKHQEAQHEAVQGHSDTKKMMGLPHVPIAVIFDMDGLLFDTEALYQRAIMAAAEEGGHDVSSVIGLMIGRPWQQSRTLLLDHYGSGFPVDGFMTAMVRHFDLMAPNDLTVKPGAIELLNTLDDLRLPRAIATSSAHRTVQRHLVAHGLSGRFHQIVAHGDYIMSKPAPDPFLKAAERLEVEPKFLSGLGGFS